MKLTWEIHDEKGNPLSLEKAHNSRETVARVVMFPEYISIKSMIVSIRATGVELVLIKRLRYGAFASSVSSREPIPNSITKRR